MERTADEFVALAPALAAQRLVKKVGKPRRRVPHLCRVERGEGGAELSVGFTVGSAPPTALPRHKSGNPQARLPYLFRETLRAKDHARRDSFSLGTIGRVAIVALALALPLSAAEQVKPASTPVPQVLPEPVAPKAEPVPTPPAPAAPPGLTPAQAARQQLVSETYRKAMTCAKANDFDGAFKLVEEFRQQAGPQDPFAHELRGSILALKKDYPAAQKAFEEMLTLAPRSHIGRFNRAEMIFLQGQYDEAEKEFSAIEATVGANDPAVADLCRYKRVLCYLAAGKPAAADLLIPPLREGDESPALSYARAAQAYLANNITKAVQLLDDARSRFSPGVDNLYTDSLVELRWGQRDEEGRFIFKPLPRVR